MKALIPAVSTLFTTLPPLFYFVHKQTHNSTS